MAIPLKCIHMNPKFSLDIWTLWRFKVPLWETNSLCTPMRSMIWKGKGLWFWHLIDKNNMLHISNCADMVIFDLFRKKKIHKEFFFLKGKPTSCFLVCSKKLQYFSLPPEILYGSVLFIDPQNLSLGAASGAQWSLTFYTIFHLDSPENINLNLI